MKSVRRSIIEEGMSLEVGIRLHEEILAASPADPTTNQLKFYSKIDKELFEAKEKFNAFKTKYGEDWYKRYSDPSD